MSWGDAVAVVGGLAAGLLSGTIGVGGGIIFVPFMTVGFRLPQTLAQGTSLVAIIPTAIVGGITHIREGNVDREGAIWMGAGGVGGAILALIAVHVPGALLARVFAVVLILNAGVLFRRAFKPSASTETSTLS
jgi:Sulfite exporter TauE/SafE.